MKITASLLLSLLLIVLHLVTTRRRSLQER